MSFETGQIIGAYRITGLIGRGGMGKVFRVEHTITKGLGAMKVLIDGRPGTAEQAQRFLREIQVQASLNHPNIASVHNAFWMKDDLVMIMELVNGRSLQSLLERGRIPLAAAINYMCQASLALSYAHKRGVVHRDITPSNIIITQDGTIKLTDFGLAKVATDLRFTQTGTLLGSLYYASPEQIKAKVVLDGRTDVYSIGVVLYEMVTGRKPFNANSAFSLMTAHVHELPAPPVDIEPMLPRELNDIILTAMAKDRAQRYRSADALLVALDRFRQGSSDLAREHFPLMKLDSGNVTEPRTASAQLWGLIRTALHIKLLERWSFISRILSIVRPLRVRILLPRGPVPGTRALQGGLLIVLTLWATLFVRGLRYTPATPSASLEPAAKPVPEVANSLLSEPLKKSGPDSKPSAPSRRGSTSTPRDQGVEKILSSEHVNNNPARSTQPVSGSSIVAREHLPQRLDRGVGGNSSSKKVSGVEPLSNPSSGREQPRVVGSNEDMNTWSTKVVTPQASAESIKSSSDKPIDGSIQDPANGKIVEAAADGNVSKPRERLELPEKSHLDVEAKKRNEPPRLRKALGKILHLHRKPKSEHTNGNLTSSANSQPTESQKATSLEP